MDLLERDEPLGALADAHRAAAGGEGSIALITGEAGIGKTSLVEAFVASLDPHARVLLGLCDDLRIPRPLGPFRHMIGGADGRIARAADVAAAPDVVDALLDELAREPVPTLLAVEDVQWADEATLDVLTVLGRRIASLPALLILTGRTAGATWEEPAITALLGVLPPRATRHLPLRPLSREAVASLAGDRARPDLYDLTDGNPFYVSQLLAAAPGDLPPSVANGVLAMAARLDPDARRLVEVVSAVPARADAVLLDAMLPSWAVAAEEPERRGLLLVDPGGVRFRHELARVAIRSSIPVARRRRIHAEILAALLAMDGDPADLVHHAEAAGDIDVVAEQALTAARRAAAAGANREAFAHFSRAADFADRLSDVERANLFEELGQAAYTANHQDRAMDAISRAIDIRATLEDDLGAGRALRLQSRIHWYAGEGAAAREAAERAVAVLEPLGTTVELGRAYSALSQLAMLAGRATETVGWGQRAVEIADAFGDHRTVAHATINIGLARVGVDPDDVDQLRNGFRIADEAGDWHEATRALLGLSGGWFEWVLPAEAWAEGERAIAYAERHQVDALLSYLLTQRARMLFRTGEWETAGRVARDEVERAGNVAQLIARVALAGIAVRRGDADAAQRLAEVSTQAERTDELQHIEPVIELEVEHALLTAAPMPAAQVERALSLAPRDEAEPPWEVGRLLGWARVAGVPVWVVPRSPEPHAAMMRGDWRAAADAFGAAGWMYDRALMLSLLDDAEALTDGLEIARRQGAGPLEARLVRRMRALGHRAPRRSTTTPSNELGLTNRQHEILLLLAKGMTNVEIADALVVSPRTVEHHVAAILARLDAPSRREAVRRARTLGAVPPEA